jgi:hypothetical protein
METAGLDDALRLDRFPADRQTAHQSRLDRDPCFVESRAQSWRRVRKVEDARLNFDPVVHDARREHFADRRQLVMLPEKRQRQFEERAVGLEQIALTVGLRMRRDADDDALVFVDGLDLERRVRAMHVETDVGGLRHDVRHLVRRPALLRLRDQVALFLQLRQRRGQRFRRR